MKLWPFGGKTEVRGEHRASYTDAVLQQQYAAATGDTNAATAAQTAAIEFGVSLVSRAFAVAAVCPAIPALNAPLLAMIGRALLLRGNFVSSLELLRGDLRMLPAASWDITGGPVPQGWLYQVDLAGPSHDASLTLANTSVIHCRINASPSTPWAGRSPLEIAGVSARLLSRTERRLSEEANARVGTLLPVPEGLDDTVMDGLRDDLAALQGSVAVVESASGAMGQGSRTPGITDYHPIRFGANPPAGVIGLRAGAGADLLGAMGIPPGLLAGGDGASARENFRQLLVSTVQPLADIVAAELTLKTGREIRLSFGKLAAVDIAARARAYGVLTKNGMDADRAEQLAGLSE